MSAEDLGRIVGESVTSIRFRSRVDRDVHVGDLLVAEDTRSRFFLRVVNVHHGAEAAGPDWVERVAGNMIAMENSGQPFRLHESDRRLYRIGVCQPLGYVRLSDGRFRKLKGLPPHFASVRRARPDDWAFLKPYMGDVEVGYLRSGEDIVRFPVGIDSARAFPYHIGVFATTGMGKSNLMKVLAGSVLESGRCGLLLLDPHGEYYDGGTSDKKGLRDHPAARRLSIYSARQLRGSYHALRLSSQEIEVADLKNLFEFSGPQADFLDAARSHFRDGWFSEVAEKGEAQLLGEVPGKFFEGTIAVVKRKLRRLVANGLVHRDPKVTVTKPILEDLRRGRVVLVDTGGLPEAEELLVATVLARTVFETNKQSFGSPEFGEQPPMLIALEEAQRVLGKGSGNANVFAQIAREGRKFKTGLCAITQQPKTLDKEVISQFNTLFILGLADKQDRDKLVESAKQDIASLETEIQTLMPGECLITSPYAPFAIPCAVHLYEEWVGQGKPDSAPPISTGETPRSLPRRSDPGFD
ncbi:MAG: ATP-binding protein [Thermoplasmatota archaeon]